MSKILIVEDDLSIQALLHDFIEEAGHSVVLASDGVEALAKYSEQPFDLILLDIMLPKIDGYGVCEVIRQKSDVPRSEERRVGKECRSRWSPYH